MDAIDLAFNERYNEAHQCYGNHELDRCIEKCQELLEDPTNPRFHRMKTLVLLGSTLGEWYEANGCHVKADILLSIVRRWHPEGEDAGVGEAMQECRAEISELKAALKQDYRDEFDAEEEVEAGVVDHDAKVEEKGELQKAAGDNPKALLIAESRVPGDNEEKLRRQDVVNA